MGVAYKDKAASYQYGIALDAPQTSGMRGRYRLARSMDVARRNLANTKQPMLVVGTPVVSATETAFTLNNRFSTGLPSTNAFTFVAVVTKATPANHAGIISSFDGGTKHDTLALSNTGQIRLYIETLTGNQQLNQSLAAVTDGSHLFVFGRCDGANIQVGYIKGGIVTKQTAAISGGRGTTNQNPLQIGGTLETGFSGSFAGRFAQTWGRSCSDADLLEVYVDLQTEKYPDDAIV